jgi:hypothetical protein
MILLHILGLFLTVVMGLAAGSLGVYLISRIASSAYFRSRAEYDLLYMLPSEKKKE